MAQPITFRPPAQPRSTSAQRLQDAPSEHAEAILAGYELLQLLHDRGILNLLRGLVGAGDELVGMAAAAVESPESIQSLRNFLLLTKFFAGIHPNVLNSLVDTIHKATKREKTHTAPGLLHLLSRLRDKDSRHALSITLDLLEGVGKEL